jgi:hypothetical protein
MGEAVGNAKGVIVRKEERVLPVVASKWRIPGNCGS